MHDFKQNTNRLHLIIEYNSYLQKKKSHSSEGNISLGFDREEKQGLLGGGHEVYQTKVVATILSIESILNEPCQRWNDTMVCLNQRGPRYHVSYCAAAVSSFSAVLQVM